MFEQLKQIIEEHDSIVLFGHPAPDGDCYGSQIGLRDALRLNYPNKQVYAVGSGYRRFLHYLGEMDSIDDEIIKNSLAILLDGNDLGRMEDERVYTAKAWIKIDHHIDNHNFVEGIQVVNEDADSTCEMVADMIKECNWEINAHVADALFLGILTDTGRFQYIDDFLKAFNDAAWLVEKGANPKILNAILNISQETNLAFKGYVYSNYQKSAGGTIYIVLPKTVLDRFGFSAAKSGSMVNLLSNIAGYPIWAFFSEEGEGKYHVEFRSNGPIVQPIAHKYGGGGHLLAAGVTIDYSEEFKDQLIAECDQLIADYKKEMHKCSKKN